MVGGWHQLDHHHSRAITRAQIFIKYKYENIFHVATNIISCYETHTPVPLYQHTPYIPPPHRKGEIPLGGRREISRPVFHFFFREKKDLQNFMEKFFFWKIFTQNFSGQNFSSTIQILI